MQPICKDMKDTKQQFEHVIAICRDLFSKKLHDYGPAWRILRPASVTDQIFIKANRIRSIETKGVTLVDGRYPFGVYCDCQLRYYRFDTTGVGICRICGYDERRSNGPV